MSPFRHRVVAVVGLGVVVAALLAGCTGGDPEPSGVAAGFTPTDEDQDPSTRIEGVEVIPISTSVHVEAPEQVEYEQSPPVGGSHDEVWAACNGIVYDTPVRNEHMVHSLEHGTVWITYDADRVTGADLEALTSRVDGQPYLMLSPYPGLESAVSLQSWGHQLRVDDVTDERIDQFVAALRANQYLTPEPGAPCDNLDDFFDPTNPPAFDD